MVHRISLIITTLLLSGLTACSEQQQTTETASTDEAPKPVETAAARPEPQQVPPVKTVSIPKTQDPSIADNLLNPAPNFVEAPAGPPRKELFFDYMVPLIQAANQQVLSKRDKIKSLTTTQKLSSKDQAWLKSTAEDYGLEEFDPTNKKHQQSLLKRVDKVPVSLALAQAANESAWGTSRFARKANNYYGQWCFTKGCGLVPKQRNDGAAHEVRAFDYPFDSVTSYIHNLNTHRTYAKLRTIRQQSRSQSQEPSGLEMAEGLVNYSQRKHEYVKELQSMIRYNKLYRFNLKS